MIDAGRLRGGALSTMLPLETMLPVDSGSASLGSASLAGASSRDTPCAGSATKSHSVGLASGSSTSAGSITTGTEVSDASRIGEP